MPAAAAAVRRCAARRRARCSRRAVPEVDAGAGLAPHRRRAKSRGEADHVRDALVRFENRCAKSIADEPAQAEGERCCRTNWSLVGFPSFLRMPASGRHYQILLAPVPPDSSSCGGCRPLVGTAHCACHKAKHRRATSGRAPCRKCGRLRGTSCRVHGAIADSRVRVRKDSGRTTCRCNGFIDDALQKPEIFSVRLGDVPAPEAPLPG